MWKKWIVWGGIFLVIAVGIGALTVAHVKKNKAEEQRLKVLQEKLAPYEEERTNLKEQIRTLEDEAEKTGNGKGNVSLVFREFGQALYDDVKEIMEKNKMKGTLVLSKNGYPGHSNYIAPSKFKELMDKGWEYCLAWDGEDTPETWDSFWSQKLKEMELEMPKAVYYPGSNVSEELSEFLKGKGVETIIHPAPTGTNLITKGCSEEPWHVYTMGWNDPKAKSSMEAVSAGGGAFVFTIGSSSELEKMDTNFFGPMLKALKVEEKSDELQVVSVAAARAYEEKMSNELMKNQEQILKQIEGLEVQIDKLDDEMGKIYEQYRK